MENLEVVVSCKQYRSVIDTALCDESISEFGLAPGPQDPGAH